MLTAALSNKHNPFALEEDKQWISSDQNVRINCFTKDHSGLSLLFTSHSSNGGNGDNVSLLVLNHGGEEGLCCPVMSQRVHLEGQLNLG